MMSLIHTVRMGKKAVKEGGKEENYNLDVTAAAASSTQCPTL